MKYELCYLVGESREQDLPGIKEEIREIVTKEGGKWLEMQVEEKRKMAYKVEKEIRGIYVAQRFEIFEDFESEEFKDSIGEMTKKLNLYQNILRFIIVKADELPELKIREIKETAKRDFRRPVYVKKSEPVAVKSDKKIEEKEEDKKEEKKMEEIEKKKNVAAETAEEGTKEKSIDEKIDEILNI